MSASAAGPATKAFDFDRLEACESGLCEHLMAQLHGAGGVVGRAAAAIVHELEETGYLETPLPVIAEATGANAKEAAAALALVQSLDPPGIAARSLEECIALQAKAADRYDPGDGAADRQPRIARQGAHGRPQAHLRGRRRGSRRHGARTCAATTPSPAAASSPRSPKRSSPTSSSAARKDGWSVELNNAALPRVLLNRRYHAELKAGAQGQGRQGVARRLRRQRALAGQGARPARADDRQGRERDRQRSRKPSSPRRRRAPPADAGQGRRGDRDARIDRQPGHLEQISRLRPRPVRAQIFLRLGGRRATAARAPRPKRSRTPSPS